MVRIRFYSRISSYFYPMKTAIVIGATGLVGSELINQLIEDSNYEKIIVLTRKNIQQQSPKIEEHLVDFAYIKYYLNFIKGDVIFSCLGTTLKKAGSKKKQFEIEYTQVLETMKFAKENVVSTCCVVSSIGANAKSSNFYLGMKGKLEESIKILNFEMLLIHRPSILEGKRNEKRRGEKFGLAAIKFFNKIGLFKKYKPILGSDVAKALRNSVELNKKGNHIFEMEEMLAII